MSAFLDLAMERSVGSVLGALIGWFIALYSEPLRRRLWGPRLWLDFKHDGRHVARSPFQGAVRDQSEWYRVSVENVGGSSLASCEPFIINVEHEEQGAWVQTAFIDPLPLGWSSMPPAQKFAAKDLPRRVPFFVDLAFAGEIVDPSSGELSHVLRLELAYSPLRINDLCKDHGRYRLTVCVTGDGIKPAKLSVIILWTGDWRNVSSARFGGGTAWSTRIASLWKGAR